MCDVMKTYDGFTIGDKVEFDDWFQKYCLRRDISLGRWTLTTGVHYAIELHERGIQANVFLAVESLGNGYSRVLLQAAGRGQGGWEAIADDFVSELLKAVEDDFQGDGIPRGKPGPKPRTRAERMVAWHMWDQVKIKRELTFVQWSEATWGTHADGSLVVPKSTFYSWRKKEED